MLFSFPCPFPYEHNKWMAPNSDVGAAAMSAMRALAFTPGDINEKDISILGSLR